MCYLPFHVVPHYKSSAVCTVPKKVDFAFHGAFSVGKAPCKRGLCCLIRLAGNS